MTVVSVLDDAGKLRGTEDRKGYMHTGKLSVYAKKEHHGTQRVSMEMSVGDEAISTSLASLVWNMQTSPRLCKTSGELMGGSFCLTQDSWT